MSRELPPAGKAAAAAKYASVMTNPLSPLAQQVGKAVAREVTVYGQKVVKVLEIVTEAELAEIDPKAVPKSAAAR